MRAFTAKRGCSGDGESENKISPVKLHFSGDIMSSSLQGFFFRMIFIIC